jgi:hypothetical protein
LRDVDGRTIDARVIATVIRDLSEHLGGDAAMSAPQRILVHSAALLAYRMRAAAERYATKVGGPDDVQSLDRHVVTLQQALMRTLIVLGIERRQRHDLTLDQYLSTYEAEPEPTE